MTTRTGQLTLEVLVHPKLAPKVERGELTIAGEVKIAGALRVDEDLNHGDELIITVATADGRVLSRAYAAVAAPPPLLPIEDPDLGLLGYMRSHKVKITGEILEGPGARLGAV